MELADLMPWGRRGREIIATVGRAFEDPWELTGARLMGGEWMPKVEVRETEREVVITASLPGVDKDALHLSVSADSLSLRGAGDQRPFYRSVTLPATVRPDDAKARFSDGELSVTLPKAKHSQVKRLTIE